MLSPGKLGGRADLLTSPSVEPVQAPQLHRELGLTDEEAASIVRILGREPNHLELAMYAVMWSEHCSYKSSKVHLRRLPTEGPTVLVGPARTPAWSTPATA